MSAQICGKSVARHERPAFSKTGASHQRVARVSTQNVLEISLGVDSAKSIALASVSAVAAPGLIRLKKRINLATVPTQIHLGVSE